MTDTKDPNQDDGGAQATEPVDGHVRVTPVLIASGVVALALGILAGLVMSAKTFVD